MNFEWAGQLYDDESARDEACVRDWLTSSGTNSRAVVNEIFATHDDEDLAQELIDEGWPTFGMEADEIAGLINLVRNEYEEFEQWEGD